MQGRLSRENTSNQLGLVNRRERGVVTNVQKPRQGGNHTCHQGLVLVVAPRPSQERLPSKVTVLPCTSKDRSDRFTPIRL